MSPFVRKHLHKILAGHNLVVITLVIIGIVTISLRKTDIGALLASATSSLSASDAIVYFTPYDDETMNVGDTRKIDVDINAKTPIDAVGITIQFPPKSIDIVGVSKEKSFLDLWTEETAIKEETGEVHFSGGTLRKNGLTGTSTALTLTIRSKKPGSAKLTFENAEVFAHDGKGDTVDTESRSLTLSVPESQHSAVSSGSAGGGGGSAGQPQQPLPRSPDLNGDGKVSLIDVSILAMRMFGPYDARFDIDMDGVIGLSDLSILFSKMGSGR